jgi:hypothetical protein
MYKTKLKIILFIFLSVTTLQATDKYIIFLQDKSQSNKTITQIAKKLLNIPSNKKNKIIKVYKVLNGFSAKLDSQTATELKYAPEVKLIERDKIITVASWWTKTRDKVTTSANIKLKKAV